MRHLLGLVLAVAAAAALFFGAGWGVARFAAINGQEKIASLHGAEALAAVAGTGLLIGLLVVIPRVSPLAAGLLGLAALGATAWWVANPAQAIGRIPLRSTAEAQGFAVILTSGLLGLIGLIAVLVLFVPSRWRSYGPAVYEDDGSDDADITATGLLG
jgi:myo-inositol catabolism protein IolC